MKLIVFSAIAALPLIARAEIGIISPAEAKALIENPVAAKRPIVLDTRGGYKDYFRGHLPTAQHINFDTLRGTDQAVPVQYLPDDLTKALLVRAGVDRDRLHLVYATGAELPNDEILSASMVVYVLEKFGVEDIRIVDGGLAEWVKQGFEPARDYFGNPKGALPKTANPGIAANVSDVQKHAGKPGSVLVDARPINEFQGDDDVWLRKGHIPGAISFHWARLMEMENTHKFKPLSEVTAELEKAGITKDKNIICYCGTSREGSLLLFFLKHVAGYPNVRLYEGAWKEYVWLNGKSLPAEAGGRPAGDFAHDGKQAGSKETESAAAGTPGEVQLRQEELEAKFKSTLTQAALSGRWCGVTDGSLTPEKEEKYTIIGVIKMDGDKWVINARIQYGQRDIVVPIPAQVKWAGDTPVICITNLTIPGGGTYTARVLIDDHTYAGTWSGKAHGGLLNGVIASGGK